eukprot:91358-Chlamydomonas_euryale.AAC.1
MVVPTSASNTPEPTPPNRHPRTHALEPTPPNPNPRTNSPEPTPHTHEQPREEASQAASS